MVNIHKTTSEVITRTSKLIASDVYLIQSYNMLRLLTLKLQSKLDVVSNAASLQNGRPCTYINAVPCLE